MARTPEINSTQREFFASNGYLHLPGFHRRQHLAEVRQQVLDQVKRASTNVGASKSLRTLPVFQQIGKLSTLVKVRNLHETLMTEELIDLVAKVGAQSPSAIQETQLLLSPPNQGTWTVEGLNWHVEVSGGPLDQVPGVQAFFLIDDVVPHGGATLALSGSHRPDLDKSRLREVLRIRTDLQRELGALGVRIVEMSGQAGDVFLMDMRILHTPSINSSRHLRMMATCRCLLRQQARKA